jgi:hypothetical protein
MIFFKRGVKLTNLVPQMAAALTVCDGAFNRYGCDCVLTSCDDGKHGRNTLHGKGRAVDLRINNIAIDRARDIHGLITQALEENYDVVLELFASNPMNNHIHVEYDPKLPK